MAHELDTLANGDAAMFSVRETPWHSLGTVLSEAPSLHKAMELAGLNFGVELRELRAWNEDGIAELTVPNHYAIVRADRNEVLSVVGGRYEPLQNEDAFRVLEPLLDSGVARLETGGTLRGGRDVWLQVRFNIDDPVVREVFADEVVPMGLLSNNHTGGRPVILQETPIRVVCANTLGAAHTGKRKGRYMTVRHTAAVGTRVIEAAEALWRGLSERYVSIAKQYKALKATTLKNEDFKRLVLDTVAPLPQKPKAGEEPGKMYAAMLERAEGKRNRLLKLWRDGRGHTGNDSAWEAYNAVAESVDHDVEMWGTRKRERLYALSHGSLLDTKDEALRRLLAYAERKNGAN